MKDKTKAILTGMELHETKLEVGQDKIPKIYNKVINVQK